MPDPFDSLDPKDGFHVVEVGGATLLSLYCASYLGGRAASVFNPDDADGASVLVSQWDYPGPAQRGVCTRLRLVLDAVARYLTTGGSWEELVAALAKARKVAQGGLAFDGYYLADSYSTTAVDAEALELLTVVRDYLASPRPPADAAATGVAAADLVEALDDYLAAAAARGGSYQHVFVRDDGSGAAVLWEEPEVGESGAPLGGFVARTTLAELGESDDDAPAKVEAAGPEAAPPGTPRLPARGDPPPPPPPA